LGEAALDPDIWLVGAGKAVIGLSRSKASLEAKILTLSHQLNVPRGQSPKRFSALLIA
jgi:hypothetical protein